MVSLRRDVLGLRLILDHLGHLEFLAARLLGLGGQDLRLDCTLVTIGWSMLVIGTNVQAIALAVECWLKELKLVQIVLKLRKFLGFGGVCNFEIL